MSLFGVDRGDRNQDPFLLWKVRLFAIGATLGLAGIFLEQQLLIWGAIGVLVAGFLLRFAAKLQAGRADGREAEVQE